jgi:putative nucleotidyltransferase with HDIG domain
MVPSHAAAAALLLSLSPSIWLRRHASAVADVASFLAVAAVHGGHPVDRPLVETAALLHDLDKALPQRDPLRRLGHGHAGAQWLTERGYAELAPAVDSHPVGRLTDQPYEDWVRSTTLEQRMVAYADKRAQQRLVTLDQRFGRWYRRHPASAGKLAIARERAGLLEAEMCALAGVSPLDVGRRSWAADALREAAAREDAVSGAASVGATSPR